MCSKRPLSRWKFRCVHNYYVCFEMPFNCGCDSQFCCHNDKQLMRVVIIKIFMTKISRGEEISILFGKLENYYSFFRDGGENPRFVGNSKHKQESSWHKFEFRGKFWHVLEWIFRNQSFSMFYDEIGFFFAIFGS